MTTLRLTLRSATFALMACFVPMELLGGEPTGPQVIFSFDRNEIEAEKAEARPTVEMGSDVAGDSTTRQSAASPEEVTMKLDPEVVSTSHTESSVGHSESLDRRRLAPLSRPDLLSRTSVVENQRGKVPFEIPEVDSLGTAGAGLVLVVGLFLLCVSLMRRGGPSPTTPLPYDAVAVLGRVPLTPKQYAHLIQVGNKLVLVSISGDRTDTITEITEPVEVERLLLLCTKGTKHSSSAEFQKLLAQIAKEPARGFLGREAVTSSRSVRG